MKVVFIASQVQTKDLGDYYKQMNDALVSHGLEVFSGHLFTHVNDSDLAGKKQIESWYKEVIQHVRAADAIFVEISYPSTVNVGHILTYALDAGKPVVANALDYVSSAQDVRFNFFISPEIGRFLDWVSKKRRLPRAVYLRKLIEEDMRNNKEYNEGSDA